MKPILSIVIAFTVITFIDLTELKAQTSVTRSKPDTTDRKHRFEEEELFERMKKNGQQGAVQHEERSRPRKTNMFKSSVANTSFARYRPVKSVLIAKPISKPTTATVEMESGIVKLSLKENTQSKSTLKTAKTSSNSAMCLSKDETEGMIIESEQKVIDAKVAGSLVPGLVVSAATLFQSSEFDPQNDTHRKLVELSTPSGVSKVNFKSVAPTDIGLFNKLQAEVAKLYSISNFNSKNPAPNISQKSEVKESTSNDKTALSLGISAAYMGISAENNFSFSEEKYRYMYIFETEQRAIVIKSNPVSSPDDLFNDNTAMNKDWLYIDEVTYGRRAYVKIETEMDLKTWSNDFSGSFDYGVMKVAAKSKVSGETFKKKINMTVISQGGDIIGTSRDPEKIDSIVNAFLKAPYSNVFPLYYKAVYMDGTPVSFAAEAFLNENNCLDTKKVRIRVSQLYPKKTDDSGGDNNEEIYGGILVYMRKANGQLILPNGDVLPQGFPLPSGIITYAKESAPKICIQDNAIIFPWNQQPYYLDVTIPDLDVVFELQPYMIEDDGPMPNDKFVTNEKFKKTLRKMLLEGSTTATFEFQYDKAVIIMVIDIAPIF